MFKFLAQFWNALYLLCITLTLASKGDEREEYVNCVNDCNYMKNCNRNFFHSQQSLLHRIFVWDCRSDCKYECMWKVEKLYRDKGRSPVQYHGKWPFTRILGIQEPASVLFSVGNLLAHLWGYNKILMPILRHHKKNYWYLHSHIHLMFVASLFAWICSSIFHTRDFLLTERFDYFTAISLVFVSLNLGIIRVFKIRSFSRQLVVAVSLFIAYVSHLIYMNFVKFNYGWNMKLAIFCGLIFSTLYFVWSIMRLFSGDRHKMYAKYSLIAIVASCFAVGFEIFDFAPVGNILDSHSCWHAATIPITLIWYKFYQLDAVYHYQFSSKKQHSSP